MYPLIQPCAMHTRLPYGQLTLEQRLAEVQARARTMDDVLAEADRKHSDRRFTGAPITDFGDSL